MSIDEEKLANVRVESMKKRAAHALKDVAKAEIVKLKAA